ncbi:MAG: hypothetical protein GW815_03490 [Candidatus Moranbacteria bacterium]|nr:hypothetical protein [Candidatus Moranbacteria bacterium]OIQ03130.1 MAG: hypothetical protein AUK58_02395 [Candidatus Moranbacteria bacterium CG2_30_41_165]PIP25964.1 MAG: hypothetical protein COX32_00545 [Candidatus Moranbacteria bacterium CG23_combo_of_CG06-09_8_20_14_all_41_28]PIV85994.1 MAG: hypothetical protein COW50_03920 [Candidatus Moranbacteria bacterium CG17_big_fil_post_rev_8_21_14_2_50_41_107]PIW94506.1 MAG: hypothetical protein COZ86_00675 [Candidatus Moranbacteria bacterium CG_
MAFSFPGKKDEASNNTNAPTSGVIPRVLTMEEDLKNITSGGSYNSTPIKQNPSETLHSSSQVPNPFQGNETADPQLASKPMSKVETMKVFEPLTTTLNTSEISSQEVPSVSMQEGRIFMFVGVAVVTLALVGGGVYYYLFVVKNKVVTQEVIQPKIVKTEPKTEIVMKKELPYATDKPNYLPLNVEVISATDIYNTFSVTASRIKENAFVDPVEFLVTDQNNAPLALSRFALLAKMNIDPKFLATLDESFSLFMYNDGGDARIGLRLSIKDEKGFNTALSASEKVLPLALQPILLGDVKNMPKTFLFKSSVFVYESISTNTKKEYPLRYTNISIEQKLSIDYAVVENEWYIGTSQNTLRALLQKRDK